jgi:hypothetical protein
VKGFLKYGIYGGEFRVANAFLDLEMISVECNCSMEINAKMASELPAVDAIILG